MTYFAPARRAYDELKANPKLVKEILKQGQEKALMVATQTMNVVRESMGLTTQYSFFQYPKIDSRLRGNDNEPSRMTISIDDFAKVEMRVGKVLEATNKEGSEKLIRLVVDVGDKRAEDNTTELRIIFTAVRPFGFTPDYFLGHQFFFITNLMPRKMLDEFSHGMIMAVDGVDGKPQFISADGMTVGARIR
jgi:methionine--tRNA ligase beta chain